MRVILLEPEKSGNIGAIARSMENFGLSDLWLVNPKAAIDSEARAMAMHGRGILESARIIPSLAEAVEDVDLIVGTSSMAARSSSNLARIALPPEELAQRIRKWKGSVGLVFGRESSGLSNQEIEACDFMVTIPANSKYNVLNVATAASIIFYEIFQSKTAERFVMASQASRQRLLLQFDSLMKGCTLQSHKRRLTRRAFRNIISRSFITKREASLVLGVLRKASAKLV